MFHLIFLSCYMILLFKGFEDSAHTVLATLISQISKSFNNLLQIPKDQQILIKQNPFTVFVMNKIMSLIIDGNHWLVVCKICDFYSLLDFTSVRQHFGYSTARLYQVIIV